ncbi:hypothetical protein [Moraxella oculi]
MVLKDNHVLIANTKNHRIFYKVYHKQFP